MLWEVVAAVSHWFEELWREFEVSQKLRDPWIWFGFGAQGLFFMRFLWQWIVSEQRHHSTIPIAFWYFSLAGGVSLFVYAVHQKDVVIMSGQALACLIYVRNLMLIHSQAARRLVAGLPRVKLRSEVNGDQDVPEIK